MGAVADQGDFGMSHNSVVLSLRTLRAIWKGVLIMWRNPDKIVLVKEKKILGGKVAKHMHQRDLDAVLRAVHWAQKMEERDNNV
tara:strand:+ start:2810 stop:3061 length:252 start_codon:yes stop_codon:yes gene_type:complete